MANNEMSTAAPSAPEWSGTTTDEQQPRLPLRLVIGLAIGAFCWIVAYLGAVGVLLPARIAEIAPDDKAAVVALNSTVSMIVAAIANILIGAGSDLTRSRLGRRTPWIWAGAIGSLASLTLLGHVGSVPALVATWAVYQIFLNSIIAPLLGTLSDRISPQFRGTAASGYALGNGLGTGLGQVIGAQFLGNTATGLLVLGILTVLVAPATSLCFRETSSLGMPRRPFTKDMVLDHFVFARHNARDYYLALLGKFFVILAKFAIQGYVLYILTDYMLLGQDDSSRYISIVSLVIMVAGIVMAFVAGPVADRLKLIKLPVIVSSLLIAVGVLVPFFSATPVTMVLYAVIAGTGLGMFNAVDQALNIAVLPDPDTAAKDLGILNLANTGGQIAGPLVAAAAISAFGYHMLFVVASAAALIASLLFALIRSIR
ncbi:MFS transporter [Actinomyces ruminicola]|uniref:MFS transporter n=1 Tax=Actinomyces ruminicola TaxID=332524 RepID=UPI001C9D1FFB|nr:MFS transporter [Actinomyces ruminicola]